jgi:CubicO group peptidase (beta-lactamase class C family)
MKYSFFLFLCFSAVANSQTTTSFIPARFNDAEREERIKTTLPVIEKLYREHAEKYHFPGYAFGVVADGKLILKGGGGYSNLEKKIPATPNSLFRIASMSKSFTTCAILQLRDEGKLTLDDPIEKYIPGMKNQHLTLDGPPISIRHCMNHLAGFPEDNPWGDRQLADTAKELLALLNHPISFSNTPGITYEYSNLGFTILGYIIQKVSGLTYDAYIKKHILDPIGMPKTTYSFSTVDPEQLAQGYRYIDGEWKNEPLLANGIYGAMGGMITSIEEFSQYVALHQQAWPERNDIERWPLKRSTLREMHVPQAFIGLNANYVFPNGKKMATTSSYTYGLNWMRDEYGKTSLGHSGGLPGFGSNWRFMPDYGIGVIFFGNVTYAPTSGLNVAVLDTLIQMAQLKPRQLSISNILTKRQKELTDLLPSWENLPDIFADNFFSDYSLSDLKKEAEYLFSLSGKIKSISTMIPENQLRGYCILYGEKQSLKLSFTLTPEVPARIQAYHLTEMKEHR